MAGAEGSEDSGLCRNDGVPGVGEVGEAAAGLVAADEDLGADGGSAELRSIKRSNAGVALSFGAGGGKADGVRGGGNCEVLLQARRVPGEETNFVVVLGGYQWKSNPVAAAW